MGMGKTVAVASAVDDLLAGLNIRRVLVVAPIRVVESVWPDELTKWDHLRWLRHVLIRGNAAKRREAMQSSAPVHLINYEMLIWLTDELKRAHWKRNPLPWDMIVFDESSKMKSPQARRFKKLKRVLPRIKRRVIMTGSPRPNSYLDVWAQIYCCDLGQRLGEVFGMFRDRWFDYNQYTYETKLRRGADKEIQRRIKDLVLCLRVEDYLKLPPLIENVVKLQMPAKAIRQYREFEKEMFLQLQDTEVEAQTAATLSMKCRQLTSGAVYDAMEPGEKPKGARKWTAIHDVKMRAVQDIVEEAQGEPLLIVYEFKHELARLRKQYPKAPWIGGGSKGADTAIKEWNTGKHRVMLVHPASVGHGINLQHGGHCMVWTSMTWSYELYSQMVARLHRQGQRQPVVVHMLIIPDTVDDTVREALAGKHKGQAALLLALRAQTARRIRPK